ncbi:MAG: MBL fold metallo-hydrolase [Patescibacteria group bacterium]|jgi:ribonuclease BN (tRNA processing enzyme)
MLTINQLVKPLALTAPDGVLRIVFIGVGSAFAQTLYQTNFLLVKGDTHIMVDFGMTGPQALFDTAGLKVTDLEVVLPTHSHADHIGGFEAVMLMGRYVGRRYLDKPKVTCVITEEYQRALWDYSLRGGSEYNEEEVETKRHLQFGDFFDVIRPTWKTNQPREIWTVQVGDIHIELFRTQHIPDSAASWETSFLSYGLFVDDRVFISGDTRFDEELVRLYGPRSEVIFHDAQFFPGGVHAPLDSLRLLPADIKAKMRLMHYGDNHVEQDLTGFAGLTKQGVCYDIT